MFKRIFSIIPIIFISILSHAQKKQLKVVAIASYNCENFFDTIHDTLKKDQDFTPDGTYHYTEYVYKQKLHNIATVIEKLATDITPDGAAIVGLVEIENDKVLSDLVSQPEIRDRHYKYVWYYTPDERGISTAMIYNPKYFRVISAHPYLVDLFSIGMKRPTRYITYVCGILAGDTVHILVNHWPSKTGGEAATAPGRKLAASIDRHIIDSLTTVNSNTKVIVMGDFNDNPDDESVATVLKAKGDNSGLTPNDIFDPFTKMYKKGIGSENFRGEWNMIDQIMVSDAFLKNHNKRWKYYDAEVFNREYLVNKTGYNKGLPHRSFSINGKWDNGYSDHFPVIIYLVEQ